MSFGRNAVTVAILLACPTLAVAAEAPIGLQVRFDRADPTYAIGEELGLVITVVGEAAIEIWQVAPDGTLHKIAPRTGTLMARPGTPLILPLPGMNFHLAGPTGPTELHIIARAGDEGNRSLGSADARLPNRASRQEMRLTYKVVPR